jgi:putative ABC transport system substrate-binding protein
MRRREFVTLLGGAAAWPLAAHAQQAERMRRIGVLLPATADDLVFQDRVGAFLQGLQQSGWTIGHNARIHTHWATANAAEIIHLRNDGQVARAGVGRVVKSRATNPH